MYYYYWPFTNMYNEEESGEERGVEGKRGVRNGGWKGLKGGKRRGEGRKKGEKEKKMFYWSEPKHTLDCFFITVADQIWLSLPWGYQHTEKLLLNNIYWILWGIKSWSCFMFWNHTIFNSYNKEKTKIKRNNHIKYIRGKVNMCEIREAIIHHTVARWVN